MGRSNVLQLAYSFAAGNFWGEFFVCSRDWRDALIHTLILFLTIVLGERLLTIASEDK